MTNESIMTDAYSLTFGRHGDGPLMVDAIDRQGRRLLRLESGFSSMQEAIEWAREHYPQLCEQFESDAYHEAMTTPPSDDTPAPAQA